jgi:hypothetical protein
VFGRLEWSCGHHRVTLSVSSRHVSLALPCHAFSFLFVPFPLSMFFFSSHELRRVSPCYLGPATAGARGQGGEAVPSCPAGLVRRHGTVLGQAKLSCPVLPVASRQQAGTEESFSVLSISLQCADRTGSDRIGSEERRLVVFLIPLLFPFALGGAGGVCVMGGCEVLYRSWAMF